MCCTNHENRAPEAKRYICLSCRRRCLAFWDMLSPPCHTTNTFGTRRPVRIVRQPLCVQSIAASKVGGKEGHTAFRYFPFLLGMVVSERYIHQPKHPQLAIHQPHRFGHLLRVLHERQSKIKEPACAIRVTPWRRCCACCNCDTIDMTGGYRCDDYGIGLSYKVYGRVYVARQSPKRRKRLMLKPPPKAGAPISRAGLPRR